MKKRSGTLRDPLKEADPWSRLPKVLPEDIFRQHLSSCNTTLDVLTTFVKHHRHNKLTGMQRDKLWQEVNTFITRCELSHFGIFQTKEEHEIRVLAYYEWQMLMRHKTPKWCRYVFNTAFADFLCVLQCREYGIALPHNTCLLNVKTKFIRYFKYYFIAKRKNLDIEDFILLHEDLKELYDDVLTEYRYYFTLVEQALQHCPSAVYYGCDKLENVVVQDVLQ